MKRILIIHRYNDAPKGTVEEHVSGLSMGFYDDPHDNCEERTGIIKVEGVQFSSSGVTLESFRFIDKAGNQWSVPTGIGNLSGAARVEANNFIRVGRSYFVDIEVCGSGGFPSLTSMYESPTRF